MFDSDATESSTRTLECDFNTEAVDLVEKIGEDLGNALTVEFMSMLKALLGLQCQQEVALEPTPMNELEKYGEVEFTVLLADAIEYCNDQERSDGFPLRMWEIIRCYYLLWQMGIVHGDISLWNLMVRTSSDGVTHFAVLNDFDLAATMEPGQECPSRTGFERTGTKPFMALDLLNRNDGTIKRHHLHDLEAMIWCMVWFFGPQTDWVYGSMRQVAKNKAGAALYWDEDKPPECASDKEAEHLWAPVMNILKEWVFSRPHTVKVGVERHFTDRENVLLFHQYLPYPERPEKKDWDSTWMAWKLPTGDIASNTETGKNEVKK
ncbi:hypothetical protein EST38_g1777 [Candolleomyces aberdarensis]|uniref:Protein kinase domain-containing protein n=1 Tax=Candolleomyces aberdarensis TaxID=2316362 RepID=A0A4Q2DUY7_9AGAR|nr:hypothetical protein EST38_g1777 [Candolleomyces aberdarensis]